MCILWLCVYLCAAAMVPKLFFFSRPQFPGGNSEEQVMCVAAFVYERLFLILLLICSQICNGGLTFFFFLTNFNFESRHTQL